MNLLDFTDPGVMEHFVMLIIIGLVFMMFFTIWFAHHTHSVRVKTIVDKIRARGPVATIFFRDDDTVTVKRYKTGNDNEES